MGYKNMNKLLIMIIAALSIPILTAADTVYPQGNFKDDLISKPLTVELYPQPTAQKTGSYQATEQRVTINNKTPIDISVSLAYPHGQKSSPGKLRDKPLVVKAHTSQDFTIPSASWNDNNVTYQEPASMITITASNGVSIHKNLDPEENEFTMALEKGKIIVK
jgi:hypothetical protein